MVGTFVGVVKLLNFICDVNLYRYFGIVLCTKDGT
jgi:hypothetical protein